jgi:hypothetical protein
MLESCDVLYLADKLRKQHNFPTLSLAKTMNSLLYLTNNLSKRSYEHPNSLEAQKYLGS